VRDTTVQEGGIETKFGNFEASLAVSASLSDKGQTSIGDLFNFEFKMLSGCSGRNVV
jgi:hypothetical protein